MMDAKATFEALPEAERQAQRERLAHLLESAAWRFARTMPQNPHWYTLRETWARDEDFVWAVEQIRLRGYRHQFQGHWYVQFDLNAFVYWSMGWAIAASTGGGPGSTRVGRS